MKHAIADFWQMRPETNLENENGYNLFIPKEKWEKQIVLMNSEKKKKAKQKRSDNFHNDAAIRPVVTLANVEIVGFLRSTLVSYTECPESRKLVEVSRGGIFPPLFDGNYTD